MICLFYTTIAFGLGAVVLAIVLMTWVIGRIEGVLP
jgi:hypothetical protein